MQGVSVYKGSALLICFIIVAAVQARPRYIDCTDNMECGLDSCCVIGGGRFSVPTCVSLRRIDEICRPSSQISKNFTVSYPDGEEVKLTNVHRIMCPCEPGLFCSTRTGTCQDPSVITVFNSL